MAVVQSLFCAYIFFSAQISVKRVSTARKLLLMIGVILFEKCYFCRYQPPILRTLLHSLPGQENFDKSESFGWIMLPVAHLVFVSFSSLQRRYSKSYYIQKAKLTLALRHNIIFCWKLLWLSANFLEAGYPLRDDCASHNGGQLRTLFIRCGLVRTCTLISSGRVPSRAQRCCCLASLPC